ELHAAIRVYNLEWKQVYSADRTVSLGPDSVQQLSVLPESLYKGADRILFVSLTLSDATGKEVSRNFYWVPVTLTSFDWGQTDYTHTPAQRYEDLTALTHLQTAKIEAHVEQVSNEHTLKVTLTNSSTTLAFQVHADARTPEGGLVAPVLWSDNWIELAPGESTTLIAELPEASEPHASDHPVIEISGWNISPVKVAAHGN
ncbi:MAG: glycosyl hydrolase family 2, partial [Silvibacterium sp.]